MFEIAALGNLQSACKNPWSGLRTKINHTSSIQQQQVENFMTIYTVHVHVGKSWQVSQG